MELKQLEFFAVVCEKGSFNSAAVCLHTSQPNVSKVVRALEDELGQKLFERGSRGLKITPYGKTVLEYAHNILKSVSLINITALRNHGRKFSLSTYPSNMIARLLVDFYRRWDGVYIVEHREGTVEEISRHVALGTSEIGIAYVAQRQLTAFEHILSHKKLVFRPLDVKEIKLYVGPNNPLYDSESVDFTQLPSLKFVRYIKDFFSMEHHLAHVSLGAVGTDSLTYAVYTNSDNLHVDALLHTDICSLDIDFYCPKYEQYPIRALPIKGCEPFLTIGCICRDGDEPGEAASWFIDELKKLL